jgi:hypothetical protein
MIMCAAFLDHVAHAQKNSMNIALDELPKTGSRLTTSRAILIR